MGTDNQFHKRRERKARDLGRKRAKRKPYARVLIVCEGEKTEPNYLKDRRDHYRLSSTNIEIAKGVKGCDPLTIANHAKGLYDRDPDFDRVFCVFDRDMHTNFGGALAAIHSFARRKRRPIPIEGIVSWPCFEYWLLLHFQFTTRPFRHCSDVITLLKKHLPKYSKGSNNMFDQTKDRLPTAIEHAKRAQRHYGSKAPKNPSTKVHEMIEYLIMLRSPEVTSLE